jgi:hypothetical protein
MEQPAAATTPPTPAGPASATPPPSETPPPRRRGRPFGSRSRNAALTETPVGDPPTGTPPEVEPQRRKRRSKAIDKDALAKQLIGVHMIAAKLTQLPFVQIDENESRMLADAIENVAREYDLELSGRTGAFIQLIAVSAVVYGPRVMEFQKLKRRAVAEAQASPPPPPQSPVELAAGEVNGAGRRT